MPDAQRQVEVLIAGYGLPGRVAAELLARHDIPHCVIERNPITVQRCEKTGTPIIEGDCTDPQVLRRAGIEHARAFLVLIPDEQAALQATRQARLLNSTVRILTRCHYTSCGIEARTQGADDVIVAEQVVATEVARRTESLIAGW
ncbi:NAD-binding protein [Fontivita pretiosa]|uniref:NAD-binding protein n=1 Tax=Fontivita pretiosa TaxID=2989684 RepID=UPI003D17B888